MTTVDLTDWTRQRWFRVVGLIFAVQLLVVVGLSSRQPVLPRAVVPGTRLKMAQPTRDLSRQNAPVSSDPWVFASAHPAGFSGSAWLHPALTDYQMPLWEDPSDFLDFGEAVSANPLVQFSILTSSPRELDLGLTPQISVPTLLLAPDSPPGSRWSLSGDLTTRSLISAVDLPAQKGVDIISNTVVQIAVLPNGLTYLARVWRSSGSHPVDLQAIAIAQTLRFAPSRAPAGNVGTPWLTWGWFDVQWHTEELPIANSTKPLN